MIVDYTGKLNNHEDYLNILNKLYCKCDYIEIVIINGKSKNELVLKFEKDIIDTKKVSEWWGTKTNRNNYLYRIKSSKELFTYLRSFETFCKCYFYGDNDKTLRVGDYSELTNFGFDDIAFYDNKENILLFTTTHEGYVSVRRDLI